MTEPRLSVALCTYNGEAYLADQLAGIAAQTLRPAELVACDDRSTDGTVRILEAFARSSPFPVRIHVNDANLGSNRNFEKAIRLCAGDLIALSDQDDVWLPEKLSKAASALRAAPRAGAVFSDAFIVDERMRPLGGTIWEVFEFTEKRRRLFKAGKAWRVLIDKQMVTGATMTFRREYVDRVVPVPPSWVHDAWIAFVVSLYADLAFIEEPLVRYRQHPGQQLGARRKKGELTMRAVFGDNASLYAREFRRYAQCRRRLKRLGGAMPERDAKMKAVRDRTVYFYSRSHMPREARKRVAVVAANLCSLRYHRFANGFLSAAKDLFPKLG